jgi:hypothetical protein
MLQKILGGICLAVLFSSPLSAAEVGKPAPDFSAKDIQGKPESVSQYKGKIVVLEWNNPGCPFVQKHYGTHNMQALQQYAQGKGVVWIAINSGAPGKEGYMDASQAKAYIAKVGGHEDAYILDPEGKIGMLYGAKATPHMFVIDTNGVLAYEGAIDSKPTTDWDDVKTADNYVRDALNALLSGKSVAVPQTRAYGCSVKYKDS